MSDHVVRFPCSSCRQQLAVDGELAGRRVKCPACGLIQDAPSRNCEAPPVQAETPTVPPAPIGTPWERRGELGSFKALIESVRQLATAPTKFFESMCPESNFLSAALFGLFFLALGAFIGLVQQFLWELVSPRNSEETFRALKEAVPFLRDFEQRQLHMLMLAMTPISVVLSCLNWLVAAAVSHIAIRFAKGRQFFITCKVVAYAQAAELLGIVPLMGPFLALIAKLALCYTGFKVCHRISSGGAFVAVVLPIAALIAASVLCVVAVVLLIVLGVVLLPH